MTINYAPTDPVAGASRSTSPTEVERWTDYADTIADVDTRLDTLEAETTPALWVPATAFSNNFGTPTLNATAGAPGWLLDAASTEVIVAMVDIPSDWSTFDIDLWWTNISGGGAGDVVMNLRYSWVQDGDTINAGLTNLGNVTLTAPSGLVLEVTAMASALAPTAGEKFRIDLRRVGGDAADTLANDAAVLGVVVKPTP